MSGAGSGELSQRRRVLLEGCDVVVTMDDAGSEVSGGSILMDGGVIAWVGGGAPPPGMARGAERVDGRGAVALPGLVNTHHHLYQTMTRARAVGQELFGWLVELYPVWAGLDPEWERAAAMVGLSELALSGCATTTDHHYLFPPGVDGLLEAAIDAARAVGLRFHPNRGSMDRSTKDGGLPPDSVVQDPDTILAETEEAVGRFHDPGPGSMLRIAVGPCSPFSVSDRLMRESVALARRLGVRLHTHIAETKDEDAYCEERFGLRPLELIDDQGFLGPDAWLAHAVHLSDKDVARVAETGSGVAWCPTSNLRLGAGVAPARDLLDAGATVGLGVDGSASNDAANLLWEARQATLVARVHGDASALSPREALRMATRGGAACLGRDDIGSIEPGKRADVAVFDLRGLGQAGAEADPVSAVVLAPPPRVRDLFVEGRPVVWDGHLVRVDEEEVAREGHRVGRRIAGRGGSG